MASEVLQLADAVVAAINAASFSQTVVAQRLLLPRFELPEMATLKVSVVPRSVDVTRANRIQYHHTNQIDVGVQKKYAQESECEGLIQLVEEIRDFFAGKVVGGFICSSTKIDPLYIQSHIEQLGQFTSVLTLTLEAIK